jgi:ribonucleotide reductase alpha subunit
MSVSLESVNTIKKLDTVMSQKNYFSSLDINKNFYIEKEWDENKINELIQICIDYQIIHNYESKKYLENPEVFNQDNIVRDIYSKLPKKISENKIYYYVADYFANRIKNHFIYDQIASYFAVVRLQKTTTENYYDVIHHLYHNRDKQGNDLHLVNEELYMTVLLNKKEIQKKLDYSRDFLLDFFAIRTLERSYLLRSFYKNIDINTKAHENDKEALILERPQHLFMRVSLALWGGNLDRVFETYDNLSLKYFTHATPTLFNSGTNRQQLASCFLESVDDNIESIFRTISNTAYISKWAGGIGIHISSIRAKGSLIRGTNGKSDGVVPLCVLLEKEARYINQGGKRNGSIALYLEPWHSDVYDFIELRQPNGDENMRARDLFLALWTPDLFMKRILENGMWSLMCPDQCPGLNTSHGDSFEKLYLKYESEGRFVKQVRALELWNKIIECQIQSGMPYLLYKDHANNKSNQKNLGTIRSSNLCVAGDTNILTKHGNFSIEQFRDQFVEIWNGFEWSNVEVKKTGVNKELMEITFNNIKHIKCTPYHKFYILENNEQIEVRANELKIGDSIIPYYLPCVNETKLINNIYVSDIKNNISIEDTYCFTEPKRHYGVFNGILTGQCAEVIEYSDYNETATCNLASIGLPRFIKYDNEGKPFYDFEKLIEIARLCTRNLNRIIDITYYPIEPAKVSNLRHRPIGIGIQGLVDVYNIFGYPFGSEEAKLLNRKIHETIYYGALLESNELSKEFGPYDTFIGSPMSKGQLQYHMWGLENKDLLMGFDWDSLVENIKTYGVRNSLLTALMPTASTAQIMGNCESFEPYHSNIFIRETLAGEFIVVNKNLMKDLIKEGLWSEKIRKKIVIDNGSIQNISEIPQKYKDIYKTAFEIKLKDIIDQSADRGVFVDQSQSLNLFMGESDRNKLHSAHIHSWKRGLKTGMYYLRSRPATDPINFGVDVEEIKQLKKEMTSVEKVCKWRPGIKLSECDVCSA